MTGGTTNEPKRPNAPHVPDKDEYRLGRQFDQFERTIPPWLARLINWLRRPGVQLVRLPLGILLVIGGLFSILPILGIWMLPLGLLILALDVRLLRGPVTQFILRSQLWLRRRRQRKAAEAARRAKDD